MFSRRLSPSWQLPCEPNWDPRVDVTLSPDGQLNIDKWDSCVTFRDEEEDLFAKYLERMDGPTEIKSRQRPLRSPGTEQDEISEDSFYLILKKKRNQINMNFFDQ